ncbi:aspartate kinase [Thermosulfuriphilus sp.]
MLIVQKYGGTSVGNIERIRNVAQRVARYKDEGHDLVVVVSAMAGETDRLLSLAWELTSNPDPRELDVLVSTGEQVSVALLAMALKSMGYQARSYLGHQVKIHTDSLFGKARITGIDTEKIRADLDRGAVVIVAGFQGVTEEGDITTLGRGGSDTTAVALAAALKADICEIFTDVEGVFTADPHIVSNARKISRVSYEEMLELASLGAKVLEIRSVGFAMRYGVPIHVRSSFSEEPGTMVVEEEEEMEKVLVSGVTYNRNEARITLYSVPDRPGVAASLFGSLSQAGIVVDMIIQNVKRNGAYTDLTFTVPRTDYSRAMDIVQKVAQDIGAEGVSGETEIAKVSIVGVGMRTQPGVASKMFETLARYGINIMMISTSEIKISCVIEEKFTELAVRALHDAFGLSEESVPSEEGRQ